MTAVLVILTVAVALLWWKGAGRNREGIPDLLTPDFFNTPRPANRAARRANR